MRFPRFILATLLVILWIIGINWLWSNSIDRSLPQNGSVFAGGFAASQARFLMLTARKSDLELQGQTINQQRLELANILDSLYLELVEAEPKSEKANELEAKLAKVQRIDKALELQLKRIDTQLEEVKTEIVVVKKIIDDNIQGTFKTFNGSSTIAYIDQGIELRREGKLEEAIKKFEQAIETDPNNTEAQINLEETERDLKILNPPSQEELTAYLPEKEKEPLLPVLRSVVKIIVKKSASSPVHGTGWIVKRDEDQAWILTNSHVILEPAHIKPRKAGKQIEIEFFSEPPPGIIRPRVIAEVIKIATNENTPSDLNLINEPLDLSVLKVDGIPDDIQPLEIFSEQQSRASRVTIIGHPISNNFISPDWRVVEGSITARNTYIYEVDAALSEGNSGGPLLDQNNRVVGIIFSITNENLQRATRGLGYAYPGNIIQDLLSYWNIL